MSSADNLCKQFRPRSDPKGMIWIKTAWHSTDIAEKSRKKYNNKKADFEKNISRRQNQGKSPRRQKESMNWNGRCYMYMQVSCLSLIFAYFPYGTVQDTHRLLQLRVCVRACVKVMTSEVCGIDFRWISGYRYSCRLVYITIAMQIYHVYL